MLTATHAAPRLSSASATAQLFTHTHWAQQTRHRLGCTPLNRTQSFGEGRFGKSKWRGGQMGRGVVVSDAGRSAPAAALHTLPALSQLSSGKLPSSASPLLLGASSRIVDHYWERCPTAVKVMEYLSNAQPRDSPIFFDHFAFRTFGVEGLGIASLADGLIDLGYTEQPDRLTFETKKLKARWYAPPDVDSPLDFPLPRIFVSELEVAKLSESAQAIIDKYTSERSVKMAGKHGVLAATLNRLPWSTPTLADWEALAAESEYAAWVLVNGYALNHTTISVHRLDLPQRSISAWNTLMREQEVALNSSGGEEKVSPDGGLRQSSTLSDSVLFTFACSAVKQVPGPYIEFAERQVLPEFANLRVEDVRECHRREGFETASADKIFESTSGTQ